MTMMIEHKIPTMLSTMPPVIPRRSNSTPAWKKIGLKLKLPQVQSYSSNAVITEDNNLKRKATVLDCSDDKDNKLGMIALDAEHHKTLENTPSALCPKKSVTFTPETKVEDGDSIKKLFNTWIAQQKSHNSPKLLFQSDETREIAIGEINLKREEERKSKKLKKKPKLNNREVSTQSDSKVINQSMTAIPPFLSYLKAYHESRGTWKFKKNHQTHLLQHIFDVNKVPSDYAHLIYAYIRGLKGQVRSRLRDSAITVKVEDREQGTAGFPSEIMNSDQKQKDYEAAIADYITTCTTSQIQQVGHEEDFLSKFEDNLMRNRIVKRMRAEMILTELTLSSGGNDIAFLNTRKHEDFEKIQLQSKTTQKKVRRRKKRTVNIEESSSNDSDSDSVDSEGADANTLQNSPVKSLSRSKVAVS